MKRIMMILMAAMMISSSAIAQEERQGSRPEKSPETPKDGKRMAPPKEGKHLEHHKKMEETMKAYDAELKKIMTEDQFKVYQADMQKRRQHREHK